MHQEKTGSRSACHPCWDRGDRLRTVKVEHAGGLGFEGVTLTKIKTKGIQSFQWRSPGPCLPPLHPSQSSSWNAVDWKGPLPSLLLGSLFAKLSWRHEVLLCAEENIAPWGGCSSLNCLPLLPPTLNFMKCKLGLGVGDGGWQEKEVTVAPCTAEERIPARGQTLQ